MGRPGSMVESKFAERGEIRRAAGFRLVWRRLGMALAALSGTVWVAVAATPSFAATPASTWVVTDQNGGGAGQAVAAVGGNVLESLGTAGAVSARLTPEQAHDLAGLSGIV